jgi:hypothetical protein
LDNDMHLGPREADRRFGFSCYEATVLAFAFATPIAIAWFSQRHVVLQAALYSFTPVGMLHPIADSPDFSADFPNGEAELLRSLVGRAYRLLGWAGLSDSTGTFVMVFAEAASLLAGSFWFARSANPHLPRWTAWTGAILLCASGVASADLGRWFHPFYGTVYNFAFGLGLAGIAAALERRLRLCGLLIGLAVTIHPIIAVFFALATGVICLSNIRSLRPKELVFAALLCGGLTAGWYLIAFRGAVISGSQIDRHLFVMLTRLMSFHWYPVRLGVFGMRAWETLIPATALTALAAALMATAPAAALTRDRLLSIAVLALILLSLAGIWFSVASDNPLLIKLALQRASLPALLIAAGICIPRLLALSLHDSLTMALTAGGLIALCFARKHGLPIFGVAIIVLLLLLKSAPADLSKQRRAILWAALGGCIVVLLALIPAHNTGAVIKDLHGTIAPIIRPAFLVPFALLVIARFWRAPWPAIVAVGLGALLWSPQADHMNRSKDLAEARAFLDVQLWARSHTNPGSVFMVDPMITGWRQYSARPSFGAFRDWLYGGWGYDSDPATMAEGIRRAGLLGITKRAIEESAASPSFAEPYIALVKKVREAYNALDAAALSRLSHENGIAYFVFNRADRPDLRGLDVVYINDQFAVVKPPPTSR